MQKNVLKHQFENFSTASNESLDKAYDGFQKMISQLEVHGAPISKEDINQKVYEDELKRSLGSNSASRNLAFLSSKNIGGTNEVSTASGDFGVSIAGGINQVPSNPCAHDVAYSFLAQPTTSPQLENEDFQQMDGDDLEELDLRWQVAMLTVKVKKKGHFTRECRSGRNQRRRSYGNNGRSNAPTNESSLQGLVKLDEYAIRNKIIESQTTKLNTKTSETAGKTNDANTEKPKSASESVVSNPKINRDRVIIEDWNSDDEEEEYEVQTVRPETQTVKTRDDKSGQNSKKQGIGFRKVKACFVCKSTDHLIKDCNFHDKKSQEPKLKNVVNTGQREGKPGNPEILLQDHVVVNSGCSTHMTGNKAYLSDYEDFNGGFVAFGSDPKGGKIMGKGKIKTANLDFDDVYFVDELKFNLFSVSQMCDKKNSVLFTESECLILSPSFKLLDESEVVLRALRKVDVYNLDFKEHFFLEALENQLSHNVKIIRCDNGTEFKNHAMNEFCAKKGIKREFSVARTPQQNDAVNTACYVLDKVPSGKDKAITRKYILAFPIPLGHGFNRRLLLKMTLKKPSKSSPKDNDIQDSEDVIDKEGQHQMPEDEQVLHDELEKMVTQELTAKAMDDVSRQAFEEEKRRIASQKKAAQATRPFVSTDRPFVNTDRSSVSIANTPYVSTANIPYVSAARTSTGANAGESSFVYLGGKKYY
ncbi:ribonuclease H-like domain-containing protein [Tanacetum coccineum]